MDLFAFDRDRLDALAATHAEGYRQADPFPHVVIDDFLPDTVIKTVMAEFPRPGDLDWHRFTADREVKLASDDPSAIPIINDLGQYNLVVGIGLMAVGFAFATRWE